MWRHEVLVLYGLERRAASVGGRLIVSRSSLVVRKTSRRAPVSQARETIEDKDANDHRPATNDASPVLNFPLQNSAAIMLFSKEYVGYLAREVSKKLVASGLIETKAMPALNEKVHAALLDELALEDRINDEVRVILEAYSDELQKTGANYQEMFRKVKTELVKKYKAVL
jgi:hypothetical protein